MFSNRLPTEKISALNPGDPVLVEISDTWRGVRIHNGKVVRLTPKQVVVHCEHTTGTIEARFRRADAGMVGSGRGELLDPEHPDTAWALELHRRKQRQRAIDALSNRWTRERDNLDVLRRLYTAVGEYLDAET